MTRWVVYVSSLWVGLSGCTGSSSADLDASDGGRSRPAPRPDLAVSDECGNGFDDDGDRGIDEGCWCGPGQSQACWPGARADRGRGACRDGAQRCAAFEFGQFGDCGGATLPDDEACNGIDDDCDGATDESCPCAEGEEVVCGRGSEFEVDCNVGRQRCVGGEWTACMGADDCAPVEVTPAMVPPAEVPVTPGTEPIPPIGTMTGTPPMTMTMPPSVETGAPTCECAIGDERPLGAVMGTRVEDLDRRLPNIVAAAMNTRDDEIALIAQDVDAYYFERVKPDGTSVARVQIPWVSLSNSPVPSESAWFGELLWAGDRWLLVWVPPAGYRTELRTLSADGLTTIATTTLSNDLGDSAASVTPIVVDGDIWAVFTTGCTGVENWMAVGCEHSKLSLQRFDSSLAAKHPPISLTSNEDGRFVEGRASVAWTGRELAIFSRRWDRDETGFATTTMTLFIVRDDRIVHEESVSASRTGMVATSHDVAYGDGVLLACFGFDPYGSGTPAKCRLFDVEGTPMGSDFFEATPPAQMVGMEDFALSYTSCGFVLSNWRYLCSGVPSTGGTHLTFGGVCSVDNYVTRIGRDGSVRNDSYGPSSDETIRPWGLWHLQRANGDLLRVHYDWIQRRSGDPYVRPVGAQGRVRGIGCGG